MSTGLDTDWDALVGLRNPYALFPLQQKLITGSSKMSSIVVQSMGSSEKMPGNHCPRTERVFSLEAAKLVAAYGVALIHLAPATPAALSLTDVFYLFPVHYFFASAIHFTVRRTTRFGQSWCDGLRVKRLLLPYFAWTGIYLLLRTAKGSESIASQGASQWAGILLFGGGAIHLYFIPLLIYIQFVAVVVTTLVLGFKNRRVSIAPLIALLILPFVSWIAKLAGAFGWWNAFPVGVFYAVLCLFSNWLDNKPSHARLWCIPPALIVMGVLAVFASQGVSLGQIHQMFAGPLFGWCSLVVLMQIKVQKVPAWMGTVVSCYFGIYLFHHAWEEGLEVVFARLGYPLVPYSIVSRLSVALLTCISGVLFTLSVRRVSWLSWILLGEEQAQREMRG